jgi:glycosyltransferase involved in cell wall biosynthesis
MEKKYPVSVCIVAFNEEKYIGACLEALRWADDIIVVDSFSADSTVEICKRYTERVVQREWNGYLDQKKYALGLAKNEWVLLMDADEVLTDAAAGEIQAELSGGGRCDGYYLRRRLLYLGRWLRHGEWYPDYKLRLFKKSKAEIGGMEPHDSIRLDSRSVKRLKGEMLHYSYENIADQMKTLNRYSSISAEEMVERGVNVPLLRMLFHPPWRFFLAYFLRKGFLDGIPGFLIASVNSFYVFLKYAKLWELYLDGKGAPDSGRAG